MSSYALSGKAATDLLRLVRESVKQWGVARTDEYVLGLHAMFQRLAEFPHMGRDASAIRPGYLRIDYASHTIFYRNVEAGVLIMHVLHERMDFQRHI
jgi:toxin ParE1/3/4